MKKIQFAITALALVAASQVNAALYNIGFTASNNEVLANGTVDVDSTGHAISGLFTVYKGGSSLPIGSSYNLVPGSGSSPLNAFVYDNMLNAAVRPFIDAQGLLFSYGVKEVRLFWNGSLSPENNIYSLWGYSTTDGYAPMVTGGMSVALVAVPEPSSYFAGLSALGMLCLFAKKKNK